MKSKAKKITMILSGAIPALALMLAVQSVTSTCFFCMHQPDVPEELRKTLHHYK